MTILVNGQRKPLPNPQTVSALLLMIAPPAPFAVAQNGDFVPRALYEECIVHAGDRIDIVHPTAGG